MIQFRGYWLMVIFYSLAMASKSLKEGYDNLQWGKRLLGRLLTTIAQVSPLDCAEECLVRPGCLSFNYRRAAIFCELNYENDSSSDTNLTEEDGWIFSLRETWPMELTGPCKDSDCSLIEKCDRKPFGKFQCTIAQCHPHMLNVTDKHVRPFTSDITVDFGSKHKVSCEIGYNQTGEGLVQCLWNGSWTDVNITCFGRAQKNYTLLLKKYQWKAGKEACKDVSGYILELDEIGEMEVVNKTLRLDKKVFPVWLGGRRKTSNDAFIWTNTRTSISADVSKFWDKDFPKNNDNNYLVSQCMQWIFPNIWKHFDCASESPISVICEIDWISS